MNWSKYQHDIYDAFKNTDDSLLIEAVAGSGKTTVLIELSRIMGRAFSNQRGAFLAFNKSIAEELGRRIETRNVAAMTLHSAGWAAWRRAGGLDWTPQLDTNKTGVIMREVMTWKENQQWGETTRKLVGLAKGAGVVPRLATMGSTDYFSIPHAADLVFSSYRGLVEDTPENWQALIDHYGIDEDAVNIDIVRRVLARGIEIARDTCDFDDMLYMPVIAGVPFDRYDVVMLDEAQDVSGIQQEMVGRMVGYDSNNTHGADRDRSLLPDRDDTQGVGQARVIAVGDRNQAIYGFRGALATSMDDLKRRFGMRELLLSVSYRCPITVVRKAQTWVPQIEWAETAEDGYVGEEGTDWPAQCEIALDEVTKWRGLADFLPGDAILCRLTRPLVEAAFTLIRGRIACRVLGRDIGKGLTDLVRRVCKRGRLGEDSGLGAFVEALGEYLGTQRGKLTAKRKFAELGRLEDQVTTVLVFAEQREDDSKEEADVTDLIRDIEGLFVDNGASKEMVVLSTIHKFKGLEADRVFVLDAGETLPCKWARQPWELAQEANLAYVACTRAKRELRYITSDDLRRTGGGKRYEHDLASTEKV